MNSRIPGCGRGLSEARHTWSLWFEKTVLLQQTLLLFRLLLLSLLPTLLALLATS